MALFQIWDCDFGFKINGVSYTFDHVHNMTIEDPEKTKMVRGANATSKTGLVYREGLKDPKTITVTILNMALEMKALLDDIYVNRKLADVFCVSRTNGSSKIYKNAVLSMQPAQLSIDDSAESMNVNLVWESFDQAEVHKV